MAYVKPQDKANVVVDIETIPLPITQEELDEAILEYPGAPANFKDPEKIAKHKEDYIKSLPEKVVDARKFKLSGKRMISLAVGTVRGNEVVDIQSFASEDLGEICQGYVDYIDEFQSQYRIIGFNHSGFDLPEIAKSLAVTGVYPKYPPCGKWDIIDLSNFPFKQQGKLKTIAKAFGIKTLGIDGSAVFDLYKAGDWDTIKKYNEDDVRITGELYIRASRVYSL